MTPFSYTVGCGKPPVHTRFQKGQSGNPSGKPGPAKLLKTRFQRALYEALETTTRDLATSHPENAIAALARQMTLDALAGHTAAQRLVLSLLDGEIAEGAKAAEPERDEPPSFSLVQGKKQGSAEKQVQQICQNLEAEEVVREAQAEAGKRMEEMAARRAKPEPARSGIRAATPFAAKLLQGTSHFSALGPPGSPVPKFA